MPEAINYGAGFSSAWSNVATFVPKFVAGKYDQEKPRIAESVRNAPSVKAQALQAKDAASSQYGNGSQPADGSGERYGATRI